MSEDSAAPEADASLPFDVSHIARLARLSVNSQPAGDQASSSSPPESVEALSQHFLKMLRFVEKLQEVDVADVEPFCPHGRSVTELRADEQSVLEAEKVRELGERIRANAPLSEGPFFVTPRVI